MLPQTPRASLSKALARVCQPLPSALSRSMTSGSSIIVTRFLRSSLGSGGRPKRANCRSSMVISRTSPSSPTSGSRFKFVIDFPFSGVGFTHRDNSDAVISHCERDCQYSPVQQPECRLTPLTIVAANVIKEDTSLPIKALKIGKIKATLLKRCLPFGLIPFEFHADNICILKGLGNRRLRLGPTHQAWGPGTCG